MTPYIHHVQYYETDKMGITHHSNYIRWMEEARIDFLNQINWPMTKLEEMGLISPVINVNCDYKKTTTFSDTVSIMVSVTEFKGVKLHLAYVMKNENDELVCKGTSSHAFLDMEGRPIKMKKDYPEFFDAINQLIH
ncbi:MAG: acyl-CoA thioesterase [Lachnospiraceae bacterium]|nr:acyl-CoA thioesterase [Lachnospiraceae bacterium]